MKTDDLISLLATGACAVEPRVAERRYAKAMVFGALGALVVMLSLMNIRRDLADAAMLPMFWLKIGFVASVVAVSLFAALRLSRPGGLIDWVPRLIAAPVLVMWIIAAYVLIQADPSERADLFYGSTSAYCPFFIALFSVPAFVSVIWAMKGLAPTRPHLAGFAAGLLAGAIAALVYCLHCTEMGAPFIGFWYVLGMMIPAAVGALLGRVLLRW
ncbi:MAG: DUF1109 domain-containing protein [Propionivibrio sp.]|nr:DUF1109 domain-containing protein [Propionivibrio sp.]